MFDIVRNNPRVVQIFLVVITLPFALWGVESMVSKIGAGETDVATVGDSKVTQQDLQQALRDQQDRLRSMLGRQFNPAMLETPEARRAALDTLVNQRLLALYAAKAHVSISDAQLAQIIASAPSLQVDGKFSPERYDALVASQNMSKEAFEARLRRDLVLQQVASAVGDTGFAPRASSSRWLAAQLEEREVAESVLKPEQFAAQVKPTDDQIKSYYDTNRRQFEQPEQLRAQYLVLSQDALAAQVTVSDAEIKAAYKNQADRYKQAEERRASHILIRAAKDAPEAEVKAARAKAEEVLAQLRKSPGEFAKLAKQYSQDPGSAEKGGDLGWFGRGAMVKPFEDAVFALKEDQISDIVRSDFGFHIIRLTDVKGEHEKPLDEVRDEIVADLKRQAAAKKFAELAESFRNTVYEQADSLKPAADKFNLSIQESPWIAKGSTLPGPLGNPKLNEALFSDDAVKNKRNTDAIEVAPNVLVSAHVAEYKPAALLPIEAVRGEIEKRLVREGAAKLAASEGEGRLAKLAKGEPVDVAWGPARSVPRMGAPGLAPAAVTAIFKADAGKLPAYAGALLPDGSYALYRISKVTPFVPGDKDTPMAAQLRQQYARGIVEEEFNDWLESLRGRYPVSINKTALETKER